MFNASVAAKFLAWELIIKNNRMRQYWHFWVVFLRGTTVDVTECWRAMYDEIKVLGKGMNKERCEVLV